MFCCSMSIRNTLPYVAWSRYLRMLDRSLCKFSADSKEYVASLFGQTNGMRPQQIDSLIVSNQHVSGGFADSVSKDRLVRRVGDIEGFFLLVDHDGIRLTVALKLYLNVPLENL